MTKKYYLSRAQTRTMSAYEPIGDAFGGAAYGEKNDPVSAGFAIYSMYEAYSVGMAALTVWQGIAAVGGALTLVGMATGNSKLTKLGQLGMLGGNIGQFAQSAMADPSALKPEGSLTSTGAEGNLAPVSEAVSTPVVNGELVPTSTPLPPVDAGPATNINQGPTVRSVDINQPLAPANSLNAPATTPGAPSGGVEVVDRVGTPTGQGFTGPNSPGYKPPPGTPGFMDKLASNPMGMYAAATVVGSVGDYLSGKTDAEIDAMKAQTGYNNAKALETQALLDKEKLRRANLNAGYTNVDTSMKVNPNVQITQPWQQQAAAPVAQPGLIAGARTA